MPEGHSVHRIARQFALHFVGHRVAASSPQGRFSAGAARIDGQVMVKSRAVGKQMFLEYDNALWLHVHLGLYGAWDFAGDLTAEAPSGSRSGSMGAPRRRLRMAEQESLSDSPEPFPPAPVGAVRVRLLTATTVGDLRGPTACDVLTAEEVQAILDRLGPDPLVDSAKKGEERFVAVVAKKPTPIGLLLMDQSVVSGIGNVYRAELLFRARLDPHTPGRDVPEAAVRALWKDWSALLKVGVKTGRMITMDAADRTPHAFGTPRRRGNYWVYHRTGEPCRVCGSAIVMEEVGGRKLYYCPQDQV